MTTIFDSPNGTPEFALFAPLQALLSPARQSTDKEAGPDETAAHIVTTVTASSDPATALWELWDVFFRAVATWPTSSYAPHLALLDALSAHSPTRAQNLKAGSAEDRQLRNFISQEGELQWSKLPGFSAQWRDVHDILESGRGDDGPQASGVSRDNNRDYFIRFCTFSATLLGARNGNGPVYPMNVFYACKNTLERKSARAQEEKGLSTEQVYAMDIRVAATWVRDGGRALWNMDHKEQREGWTAALDEKTELWPREDGLTRERWQLWRNRLQTLGSENQALDEDTKAVVAEAAKTIDGLLGEASA